MLYSTKIPKLTTPLVHHRQPARRGPRNFTDLVKSPEDNDMYKLRIIELEQELQKLNILDDALRIIEICNQIRILKKEITR
jgi:hypothetical protein